MADPFVADTYDPPASFEGPGFRLEPLGPQHNERDHAAWMSSMAHIRATPGFPHETWPEPMSLEANLEDLERHARDFEAREGFTYSILDGEDVIGCLYIYPTTRDGHDAEVSSWVTEARADLDVVAWSAISAWIASAWPFERPYYAERS